MGGHIGAYLANKTELSVCGGDAALCQTTLTLFVLFEPTVLRLPMLESQYASLSAES